MKGSVSTSKIVLAIALVNLAVTGCGRKEANETGAAGSTTPSAAASGSATAPASSADTSAATAPPAAAGPSGTPASASESGASSAAPSSTQAGSSGSATTPGSSASGTESNASSGTSGSSGSSSVGTAIDDTVLTTKVKSALMADADIKSSDITVVTKKGEVQLSGFLASQQQVDKAVKVARAVEGVKAVDNKLTVKK